MKKQSNNTVEEKDDGKATSFECILTKYYGEPGTVERQKNDKRLETIEMMQVLKEMRKTQKIKLKSVAAELGVDESVISKLENTRKDIQIGTLKNYIHSMNGHLKLTFTIGNNTEVFDLV